MNLINRRTISCSVAPVAAVLSSEDTLSQILVRVRDYPSISNFFQTCHHTAQLATAPTLVSIQLESLSKDPSNLGGTLLEHERTRRRLYAVKKLGPELQTDHLPNIFPKLQAGLEESWSEISAELVAVLVLHSGNVPDVKDVVVRQSGALLQHAMSMPALNNSYRELNCALWHASQVGCSAEDLSNACLGYLNWIRDFVPSAELAKTSYATYVHAVIATIPAICSAKFQAPVLSAIANDFRKYGQKQPEGILDLMNYKKWSHGEEISVTDSEAFFSALNAIIEGEGAPCFNQSYLRKFASYLSPVPWQENSAAALAWLVRMLTAANKDQRKHMVKGDFEACFTRKELAYLLDSTAKGDFTLEGLAAVEASNKQKCIIS